MIVIISSPVTLSEIRQQAQNMFVDMTKVVVDIKQRLMAINGELHSDEEQLLLTKGSRQQDLWGINLYFDLYPNEDWIEFDSMINLRPSQGNLTRGVDDATLRATIRSVILELVQT